MLHAQPKCHILAVTNKQVSENQMVKKAQQSEVGGAKGEGSLQACCRSAADWDQNKPSCCSRSGRFLEAA